MYYSSKICLNFFTSRKTAAEWFSSYTKWATKYQIVSFLPTRQMCCEELIEKKNHQLSKEWFLKKVHQCTTTKERRLWSNFHPSTWNFFFFLFIVCWCRCLSYEPRTRMCRKSYYFLWTDTFLWPKRRYVRSDASSIMSYTGAKNNNHKKTFQGLRKKFCLENKIFGTNLMKFHWFDKFSK